MITAKDLFWGPQESEATTPPEYYNEMFFTGDLYNWLLHWAPEWRLAPTVEYIWRKQSWVFHVFGNPTFSDIGTVRVDMEITDEETIGIDSIERFVEFCGDKILDILFESLIYEDNRLIGLRKDWQGHSSGSTD